MNKGKTLDSQSSFFQSFLLSKLKFIIPYSFCPCSILNELRDLFFVVKISFHHNNFTKENLGTQTCFIFKNTQFIIENYSSNAMKLLALERIDIFGTNHLFIGNYIFVFKSNLLKKAKNKKIKKSSVKKTKEYNINSKFICLPTPIRILNKTLGYLLNFTKVSYYSFANNCEIVNKTYIPLQDKPISYL